MAEYLDKQGLSYFWEKINQVKQDILVSGTNIKTINNQSLLGSGNISISGGGDVTDVKVDGTSVVTDGVANVDLTSKQDTLISGTNIKTVNNNSLLGSGNVAVQETLVSGTNIKTVNSNSLLGAGDVSVQETLVSGTNIKTINNQSLLGSGNISISGGGVTPDDYVVDHGESGNWKYRKWNSGKIEAWFEGTFSCASSTTARGALYYSTWSLTIPSEIGFTSSPFVIIGNTGDSSTVISVNGSATSNTQISGRVWRYASSTSALIISSKIYAWQD